MSRPKCSICRGAGCHVCFDKGYIEEWPTERLEREKQQMAEVLEAVEWIRVPTHNGSARYCPWCESWEKHAPDCQRQAILARVKGEL